MARKKSTRRIRPGEGISLTELIESFKRELHLSDQKRDADFKPLFRIDKATVEVQVSARREKQVEGSVRLYVAEIGAAGSEEAASGYKLSVTLAPLDPKNPAMFRGGAAD